MNYVKPFVTSLRRAITTIQGQQPGSKIGTVVENFGGLNHFVTVPAYEADE
jgi:hypothetical protein